jgi:hypothetical protein
LVQPSYRKVRWGKAWQRKEGRVGKCGLEFARLDWTGLDFTGLDSIDWTRLYWTRLDPSLPQEEKTACMSKMVWIDHRLLLLLLLLSTIDDRREIGRFDWEPIGDWFLKEKRKKEKRKKEEKEMKTRFSKLIGRQTGR